MIINLLRIFHGFMISLIILKAVQGLQISYILMYGEIALTISRAIIEKKISSLHFKIQIILSLVLGYYIFPNKFQYVSWLFFIKTIEVHKALKAVRLSSILLNKKGIFKYISFAFDLVRYSVCQYIVLGISMMIYRYLTDCRTQPLPSSTTIMYQLVVTASTIGYGDIVPKSQQQIIFLTYLIPVICGSFVIYTNHLVDIFTKTFLEQQIEQSAQQKTS